MSGLLIDILLLTAAIFVIYSLIGILEPRVEASLLGRSHSLNDLLSRIWIYVLFPAVFSFSGVGLLLLPNAGLQEAIAGIDHGELISRGPFSSAIRSRLDVPGLDDIFLVSFLFSIMFIAVARVFIVTYSSSLVPTIFFYLLGGCCIFILALYEQVYFRVLIDYLTGEKPTLTATLVFVGIGVGTMTEVLVARHATSGARVGQRPGVGAYVCKTCQRMQYLESDERHLERCQGLCPEPVFRRAA